MFSGEVGSQDTADLEKLHHKQVAESVVALTVPSSRIHSEVDEEVKGVVLVDSPPSSAAKNNSYSFSKRAEAEFSSPCCSPSIS